MRDGDNRQANDMVLLEIGAVGHLRIDRIAGTPSMIFERCSLDYRVGRRIVFKLGLVGRKDFPVFSVIPTVESLLVIAWGGRRNHDVHVLV